MWGVWWWGWDGNGITALVLGKVMVIKIWNLTECETGKESTEKVLYVCMYFYLFSSSHMVLIKLYSTVGYYYYEINVYMVHEVPSYCLKS